MRLSEDHKRNISNGLKERWERKRRIEEAKDRVIEVARLIPGKNDNLKNAIKELDDALASD